MTRVFDSEVKELCPGHQFGMKIRNGRRWVGNAKGTLFRGSGAPFLPKTAEDKDEFLEPFLSMVATASCCPGFQRENVLWMWQSLPHFLVTERAASPSKFSQWSTMCAMCNKI